MKRAFSLKITRILSGENAVRPIPPSGYTFDKVPEDGYIIESEAPGGGRIYLRDRDLETALAARRKTNAGTPIKTEAW